MSGAEDAGILVQPSVFLDTSVLVSLFHFWDACKSAGAGGRLDEITGWKDLERMLKSANLHAEGKKATPDINRGINAFRRLTDSWRGHHYFSSLVCWSQLHHALLEARALEGLVRRGVPQGLRMKRPQRLYRVTLQRADYNKVQDQTRAFGDSMHLDYGIDVINVEDPSRGLNVTSDDIWDAAREIWSHVLMDVLDAYTYAAASLVHADVFFTGDENLRPALKLLHAPDSEWAPTVVSLRQALGLVPDATLPRPLTPGAAF